MLDHEELISELRKALAHLDDALYLEKHPLAQHMRFPMQGSDLSWGQGFRRVLRLAIDDLSPQRGDAAGPLDVLAYEVLYRYAVAKHSVTAIATQMGITERQAYRELRRGIEALAQGLSRFIARAEPEAALGEGEALSAEVHGDLERLLGATDQDVNVAQLLAEVVENARVLAAEKGVEVGLVLEASGLHVTVNRVMLRQALLNILSYAIGLLHPGEEITVRLSRSEMNTLIELAYCAHEAPAPPSPKSPYAVSAQLLELMHIPWSQRQASAQTTHIVVSIPLASQRAVLIVDDNEDLIALFRRYLRHQPYSVQAAESFGEALRKVNSLKPDVVILDVMMPGRDGWEVLQTLQATQAARSFRIIVCSIINDPELATALGADAFLNKPVSRKQLLQTLREVLSSSM